MAVETKRRPIWWAAVAMGVLAIPFGIYMYLTADAGDRGIRTGLPLTWLGLALVPSGLWFIFLGIREKLRQNRSASGTGNRLTE